MPLLDTRQDSGILDCSEAELEPGAEGETLRPKAYTLQVVYSRQMRKAFPAQKLSKKGSCKERVGFWVMVPLSYQTVVRTDYSGRHIGLSELRPRLRFLAELISWKKKKIKINARPSVPDIHVLRIGGGGLF